MSKVVSVKTTVKSYIKKSYSNKENLRCADTGSAKYKQIIKDLNKNPEVLASSFKGITLIVKPSAFQASVLPPISQVISIADGGLRTEILKNCKEWARPDILDQILATELNIFIEELPMGTSMEEHVTRLNGSRATTSLQRALSSPSLRYLNKKLDMVGIAPIDTKTLNKGKLNTQTYIMKALFTLVSPSSFYKSAKAASVRADWEALLSPVQKEEMTTFINIIEGLACANNGLPTEKGSTPSALDKNKNYIVGSGVLCTLLSQIRNAFFDEERGGFFTPELGSKRKKMNAAEVLQHPQTQSLLLQVKNMLIIKPDSNTFCQEYWGKNYLI